MLSRRRLVPGVPPPGPAPLLGAIAEGSPDFGLPTPSQTGALSRQSSMRSMSRTNSVRFTEPVEEPEPEPTEEELRERALSMQVTPLYNFAQNFHPMSTYISTLF